MDDPITRCPGRLFCPGIYVHIHILYLDCNLALMQAFMIYLITRYDSLRKKFFSSQAQRADNRQNWEARKKLHKPELFFLPKHGRFWNFNMINLPYLLQWHPFVSLIKRICISAPVYILRKEFWFVLPYFLSLLSTILQAQSGLRSWNFTCPVRILQVSDIGLVLSFEDWYDIAFIIFI